MITTTGGPGPASRLSALAVHLHHPSQDAHWNGQHPAPAPAAAGPAAHGFGVIGCGVPQGCNKRGNTTGRGQGDSNQLNPSPPTHITATHRTETEQMSTCTSSPAPGFHQMVHRFVRCIHILIDSTATRACPRLRARAAAPGMIAGFHAKAVAELPGARLAWTRARRPFRPTPLCSMDDSKWQCRI